MAMVGADGQGPRVSLDSAAREISGQGYGGGVAARTFQRTQIEGRRAGHAGIFNQTCPVIFEIRLKLFLCFLKDFAGETETVATVSRANR
jgi:hypothetical protein